MVASGSTWFKIVGLICLIPVAVWFITGLTLAIVFSVKDKNKSRQNENRLPPNGYER